MLSTMLSIPCRHGSVVALWIISFAFGPNAGKLYSRLSSERDRKFHLGRSIAKGIVSCFV